ncbi:GIY-YIG nuclease family protein [Roseibium litorale]|uniref:GIY-YIG nuclease family protein n=1 Tax=Roseibium litorale TaxID=2803841 RepID=A0ABR9CJ12_9HYPH|nr:GIY-YIG nuclease family protein [Roseibium litorale]MBD8890806.1 GIY-YIG nuclease family protein [Roseibium litorale]
MSHFVYILANKPHGAIYIGSARDLRIRLEQHRAGTSGSHTEKYNVKTLVYFELHESVMDAVHRERRLKRWRREWKEKLINEANPDWKDISAEIPF